MAKNDQQEAFERVLTSSLARTIDFVKYAEAKNAALLTFSSAWAFAIATSLNNHGELAKLHPNFFAGSLALFISAAIISLYSFLPRRNLLSFHRDPEQVKSLVYFGDAAAFDTSAFCQRIKERYFPADQNSATQAYLDDLATQICVNSKIANRKFSIFNIGGLVTGFAFAVLVAPWPISVVFRL